MANPHQTSLPPQLQTSWSLQTMIPGQPNTGQLALSLTTQAPAVELSSGDRIQLGGLPVGWGITSDSGWSFPDKDNKTCLIWGGPGTFTVRKGKPKTINLSVTPPVAAVVGQITISVQLQDESGLALTQPWTILFNLTLPSQPVVAFANTPAAAILSAVAALPFSNTLACTLLNTSTAVSLNAGVNVSLSFIAQDANGKSRDISQQVKSDNVIVSATGPSDNPVTFSASTSGDGTWSASLPDTWNANDRMTVTIAGLEFMDTTISLVEVQFNLTGIGQPYTTSAWFNAVGPFTLSTQLNTTDSNAKKYRVDISDAQQISITSLYNQPPIAWCLVDSSLNHVDLENFVLGYLSLDKTAGPGQGTIDSTLLSTNTLYFLAGPGVPIASIKVNLNQLNSASIPSGSSGLDFSELDLSGQDFTSWNNLSRANFTNANLGTDGSGKHTKLTSANNPSANLACMNPPFGSGTLMAWDTTNPTLNLLGVNQLIGTNFTGANLTGADLTNANLCMAILDNADLTGANLTGVLSGVPGYGPGCIQGSPKNLPTDWNLVSKLLIGPGQQLNNADLTGAHLGGANLTNANLSNATLTGVNLTGATLTGAMLGAAEMTGATLTGVISGGILGRPLSLPANWNLVNGYLVGPGADLTNATLGVSDLANAIQISIQKGPSLDFTNAILPSSFGIRTSPPLVLRMICHNPEFAAEYPSATLTAPPNHKILCAGALDAYTGDGNMLTACYPESQSSWTARGKDHRVPDTTGSISMFGIALYDPLDQWDVQIQQSVSQTSESPSASVELDEGYQLVGGGAFITGTDQISPTCQLLTASYPSGNGWCACSHDNWIACSTTITAYAIGLKPRDRKQAAVEVRLDFLLSDQAEHPRQSVSPPAGHTLVGGGVRVNSTSNFLVGSFFKLAGPQDIADLPDDPNNIWFNSVTNSSWIGMSKSHLVSSPATLEVYALSVQGALMLPDFIFG